MHKVQKREVKHLHIAVIMLSALLSAAAQGAPNVFDDAVFWFRGGKDKNGDGYMRHQGEFFDDLHADDATHANHQMGVQTYSSPAIADGFKANAVFRQEKVVFPALGRQVVKNGSCICPTTQSLTVEKTITGHNM